MDGLGLVCESHRSTEVLTSQEMDLIQHFLPANLNSQSPHVRQQTISLLKKVLLSQHYTPTQHDSPFTLTPFVSFSVLI